MIISLGAVIVSFSGAIFNYYKLKDDQKTWEQEQKILMDKKILFKTLKKRQKHYKNIFRLLGKVRDIEYPNEHHEMLKKNKNKLIKIADQILIELYGTAGLFMSYETRSAILKTYQYSYKYARNEIQLRELIDSYYKSRRLLREDLEFDDTKSSKTAKKILKNTIEHSEDLKTNRLKWAQKTIFGELAYSPRPGYPNKVVSLLELNTTIAQWKKIGIKSIICLLSEKEINEYYQSIEYNLIYFYKQNGFEVFHIDVTDFQKPELNKNQLYILGEYYKTIKKHPTLIHCGAGEDRSGYAIAYLENEYSLYK